MANCTRWLFNKPERRRFPPKSTRGVLLASVPSWPTYGRGTTSWTEVSTTTSVPAAQSLSTSCWRPSDFITRYRSCAPAIRFSLVRTGGVWLLGLLVLPNARPADRDANPLWRWEQRSSFAAGDCSRNQGRSRTVGMNLHGAHRAPLSFSSRRHKCPIEFVERGDTGLRKRTDPLRPGASEPQAIGATVQSAQLAWVDRAFSSVHACERCGFAVPTRVSGAGS